MHEKIEISDINENKESECYLVSLGWLSDDESGFNVIEVSQDAIIKELLQRHHSECSDRPMKIEHAKDNSIELAQAFIAGLDSETLAVEIEDAILAKGLGVSFWRLTVGEYQSWKGLWDKRQLLFESWLETKKTGDFRSDEYEALENEFMYLFETDPLVRMDLSMTAFDLQKARAIANDILLLVYQNDE